MHFFLFDVVVIFIVPVILVIEIGTRGVVTEAFITARAFVVVALGVLEVDAAVGNHFDFFCDGRDRKLVGSDRSVLQVAIVFCRIDALRDEVLFLAGIEVVFMLP